MNYVELCKSIGRMPQKENADIYEADEDKIGIVSELISTMLKYNGGEFFGMIGKVSGSDMVFEFNVSTFDPTGDDDCGDSTSEIIEQCDSIEFIPNEGYMTVRVLVKNIFLKV